MRENQCTTGCRNLHLSDISRVFVVNGPKPGSEYYFIFGRRVHQVNTPFWSSSVHRGGAAEFVAPAYLQFPASSPALYEVMFSLSLSVPFDDAATPPALRQV